MGHGGAGGESIIVGITRHEDMISFHHTRTANGTALEANRRGEDLTKPLSGITTQQYL